MGVHPGCELIDNYEAKVNRVADEVELGDFRGLNLNNGPVVSKTVAAIVESDRGRKNNMANDTVLFPCPIPLDIFEQLF